MAEFEKKTKRHSRKLDRASLTSMYVARYERDFLDYEFARAKVIPWGESAYADERPSEAAPIPMRFANRRHGEAASRRGPAPQRSA